MSRMSRIFSLLLRGCELPFLSSSVQHSLELFSVPIVPCAEHPLFLFAFFFTLPILHASLPPLFLFVPSPLKVFYVLPRLLLLVLDVLPLSLPLISIVLFLLQLQVLIALLLLQLRVSNVLLQLLI